MSKYTQKAIMKTFLEMLEYKSLDKITIKDIIEKEEINRNTFYYYFDDIYDLIDKIFEAELNDVLKMTKEDSSFYDAYVRNAAIIFDHKQAISHIYHSKSSEIVRQYIEKVTTVFVERFVRKEAEGRHLSEEGVEFITFFYSSAIVASTLRWVEEGMPSYRENFLKTVSSSFESTIQNMIQNYIGSENKI